MRAHAIAAALLLWSSGLAADTPDPEGWSRFRGPNGSGVSTSTRLPAEFGPDTNVVWKTELPFGHSSPALTRDRIFLTGARGERLVTICLDRRTGKILWERDAPRSRVEKLDTRNGPAGPTPATDGTNVYVFFADFGLLSYDMEGKERWRLPLGPFNNLYGMGASPVLVDDAVVLACDQNTDSFIVSVGAARRPDPLEDSAPRGAQRPLDAHPLCVAWRRAANHRPGLLPGDRVRAEERREALVGRRTLVRDEVDAGGERRHPLHQRVRHAAESARRAPGRFRPSNRSSRTTADAAGKVTFANLPNGNARSWIDLDADGAVSAGEWDYYRAAMASENGMLAIRLGGRGDMTASNVRWKYHKSVPQLPSPLVYHNVLYMVNDGGIVTTLNPESGAEMGQGRLKGAIAPYYASPVAADGKIYMASETGKVAVLAPGGGLEPIVVNDLHDDIYATPAISDGRIYLRTRGWLYCFGLARP